MIETFQISQGELRLLNIRQSRKNSYRKNGKRKYLSESETQQIIKFYPDHFNWQLERMFDVSASTIYNVRREYNLSKSLVIMNTSRFKKGHIPVNKGKHYKMKNSGQFKKGHLPKNSKPIGTISERSNYKRNSHYLYIKVARNKWKLLHYYIWKKEKGSDILKGMNLIFRDGNFRNCNLDNLKLISNKENMERNRNRKKAAESLRKIWSQDKLRVKYGLNPYSKFFKK